MLNIGSSLLSQIPPEVFPIIIIGILILIVLIIWFIWSRPLSASTDTGLPSTQWLENLSAATEPLLLPTEATLFNMIRLVVQDNYLIFAKLPLLTVLTIHQSNRHAYKSILKTIQHVRIDVALVHPGTLHLEKVIRFSHPERSTTQSEKREQLVTTLLESADIAIIPLELGTHYTMPELTNLVGLAEED